MPELSVSCQIAYWLNLANITQPPPEKESFLSPSPMIILPTLLFTTLAVFMTLKGNRKLAVTSWVFALIFMLGAMHYHMDDVLPISL